jgi:hypothetical protein
VEVTPAAPDTTARFFVGYAITEPSVAGGPGLVYNVPTGSHVFVTMRGFPDGPILSRTRVLVSPDWVTEVTPFPAFKGQVLE